MKIVFNIMMILFLFFVAVLYVSAEDLDKRWKYFATNGNECNFYYDTESIKYLPNNFVKVWEKMLCPETSGYVILKSQTLKEIDCNNRTYRYLQSDVINVGPSSRDDGTEIYPESWMETLYNTVCKTKEKRN